jgi:antitoxin component YwqK of YwqJK toxin-antitoxin module
MKTRYLIASLFVLIPCLLHSQNQTDSAGKKQGPWIKNYPNGKIMYEGAFKDDKPVGLFKRYNEDGVLQSELTYSGKNDEAQVVFFHPDGQKAAEGIYVAKKKEGLWKFYSATKPCYLIGEENYYEDIRHGLARKFYPDSSLAEKVTWDFGKKTGEWLQYYPDGTVCVRAEYFDGKLEGPFSFYHPNGRLQYEGRYKADVRIGDWMVFNDDGSLKQILEYKNGKLADPKYAEKETKFLDDLEKNRGKIQIPDISGNIIK